MATAVDTLVESLVGDLSAVRAPRGSELHCKGWHQEAALRMLCNNLDPEVAEDPTRLVVYGGSGRAARSHAALKAIVAALLELEADETLLVQSGKPVGIFRTHPGAPRVLIANSLLVPRFANWDEFRRLEAEGLTMFGQMTAGSWIYIGTQGILQGTYQTFAAAGEVHWGSPDLAGRTVLTAGLGGMGGAQPLAASLAGAASLNVEVDPHRIERRIETRYLDEVARDLDDAVERVTRHAADGRGVSVGLLGNAGDVFPELARRGVRFDLVTDQTSAHDMLNGYVPAGMPLAEAIALRTSDPDAYVRRARETAVRHVQAMLDMQDGGSHVFDYGNNLRTEARDAGLEGAFGFPGFVPAYVRPLFCVGRGPVPVGGALGRSGRHRPHRPGPARRRSPTTRCCSGGCTSRPTGWRSRACRRGSAGSATATAPSAGLIFNDLVRRGEVSAPIVIGRDHLDTGSVASPFRETEAMRDGSDAIADWPILNALLSASSGASWVSVHHGGGVGIGNSIHAGLVIVADGTPEMDERLARVLTNDPGIGVARHADAGYETAIATAHDRGVRLPMEEYP